MASKGRRNHSGPSGHGLTSLLSQRKEGGRKAERMVKPGEVALYCSFPVSEDVPAVSHKPDAGVYDFLCSNKLSFFDV